MRFKGISVSQHVVRAGLITAMGGLLWVPYGVLRMVEPWGEDVVYQTDLGYALVTNATLFVAYGLPGSLALLLTVLGLLDILSLLGLPVRRAGRIGRILAYLALALAVLSLAGVVLLIDPLSVSGLTFGSLALGAATCMAGVAARTAGTAAQWTLALLALGLMGLLLLPLWPLVYALQWVPASAGAAFIALFGVGWLVVGYRLWAMRLG